MNSPGEDIFHLPNQMPIYRRSKDAACGSGGDRVYDVSRLSHLLRRDVNTKCDAVRFFPHPSLSKVEQLHQ